MNAPDIALPVARYRLEFEVTKDLHLPAYAGSTLRGAWGSALRAICCMTRLPVCDNCPLLDTCPYAAIFETRPHQRRASFLQNFTHVPRPYVIEPPQMGKRSYIPGERFSFHIVLVGRALEHLSLILWAYVKAFRRGVGSGDGTAELLRAIHMGETETIVLEAPGKALKPHDPAIPKTPDLRGTVTLQFHTPLRLQTNGRRATREEHTARKLLTALIRRIALLNAYHGNEPFVLDLKALANQANLITSETQLRWHDWTRYSTRQKKHMALGGVVGTWKLTGDLTPFAPFLHLGQWVHVGKEATFGLGKYHLTLAHS